MHPLILRSLFALASLALGFMAAPALAQPIEYDKKTCICSEGSGACQKFLRAPKKVTVSTVAV